MTGKGTFVSILKTWGSEDAVRKCFIAHAPGGEVRFQQLMEKVNESFEIVERKFLAT